MNPLTCKLDDAPSYLRDQATSLGLDSGTSSHANNIKVLDLSSISQEASTASQYFHLLLRRHALTQQLAELGLHPPLIHERALVYEALGYADLAAADAFVTCTLCEAVRSDEWGSDLEPVDLNGEAWPSGDDSIVALSLLCDALSVLYRSLVKLGATEDAEEKFTELVERYGEKLGRDSDDEALIEEVRAFSKAGHIFFGSIDPSESTESKPQSKFGWSRREIYPWNDQEPDRNSLESLSEINSILSRIAPDLEAKVTVLPALNEDGSQSSESWYQLGLFAAKDLSPGLEVLREKSLLTAIRPLDDALCDACGADLESIPRDTMRECPGADCDTTFCSEDCATRAAAEYHKPNLSSDTDDDHDNEADSDSERSPRHEPFCGNETLHEIGRTTSTSTPEWDLYFLLLTRTISMSTTQQIHPLSLPSIKYLWGDFHPAPDLSNLITTTLTTSHTLTNPAHTLPWSLHHNLTLPLQYFETLMLSLPSMTPYSAHWLANFDWWTQTTLLAKFRGVANAQQSTFDGKAEIAAVHPMWCLANHSCQPNVGWTPTGERVFVVKGEKKGGIKAGEEVWSHYTDVRLSVGERRERLLQVLGGVCRCERCVREGGEGGNGL